LRRIPVYRSRVPELPIRKEDGGPTVSLPLEITWSANFIALFIASAGSLFQIVSVGQYLMRSEKQESKKEEISGRRTREKRDNIRRLRKQEE
jgi:hypothetical protein